MSNNQISNNQTQTKFIDLTDDDLKKNKYSPEQLEYSIINNNISLRILNRYQKLTPYICAKYVIFGGKIDPYKS